MVSSEDQKEALFFNLPMSNPRPALKKIERATHKTIGAQTNVFKLVREKRGSDLKGADTPPDLAPQDGQKSANKATKFNKKTP